MDLLARLSVHFVARGHVEEDDAIRIEVAHGIELLVLADVRRMIVPPS